MKIFETLARYTTPSGQELVLHRRDGDFFVNLDGEELMASRAPESERALARMACEGLGRSTPRPRVLIGGLGLGYTLNAALGVLPATAEVVVAEVFACVIEWNRTFLADFQGDALTDSRTQIRHVDVWDEIRLGGPWNAIMLDVDNGPDAWCLEQNQRLYDRRGLAIIKSALAPGGVAAFWSAQRNDRFLKMLKKSGFDARCRNIKAQGVRHQVFLAYVDRSVGAVPGST